jgi:site-specific DNA-methyltransferase (adenine-specific)
MTTNNLSYETAVIQGDCLEVMRGFSEKQFDLVLTDPPYGLGIDGQKQSFATNPKHDRKAHEFMEWDKQIPSREYFDEMKRVSKNQIIWGGNYFLARLDEGHKGWLVWDKGQHGLTMSDGELAYTSFDVPLRIFTLNRGALRTDGAHHPTMKPLELMKWCLEMFTTGGDSVLDPFMGSGTTLVAAKQLGLEAVGIDIHEKYCEIARKRLEQESLFNLALHNK